MRRLGVRFVFELEVDLVGWGVSGFGVAMGSVFTNLSYLEGFSGGVIGFGMCTNLSSWTGSVGPAGGVWTEEEEDFVGAALACHRI